MSRDGTGEQQRDDVHAGDDKHESNRRPQHEQNTLASRNDLLIKWNDLQREVRGAFVLTASLIGGGANPLQFGGRRFKRRAWRQLAEHSTRYARGRSDGGIQ